MKVLSSFQNGDTQVTIYDNGDRIMDGDFNLQFPMNIDIRVSTKCAFGQRDDGSFVLCSFCHESAKVNGVDCDYELLKEKLVGLPMIELAIGCNELTQDLFNFLAWAKDKFICNLTINSGHIKRDEKLLRQCIDQGLVKGVGVSYRKGIPIPQWILDYEHTVVHTIVAIDDVDDLKSKGFKKILVLGCKDFGFNVGKVDQEAIREWYRRIPELLTNPVAFDNLAVEQLNMRRFYSQEQWDILHQGEYSMYIDAVAQVYAPSSRSNDRQSWDTPLTQYFQSLDK